MKRRNRLSSKAAAAIAVAVGIRLVAIARLLLYLRLLGQVTNLFPQLTRRLSAGELTPASEAHARSSAAWALSMSSSLCRLPSSFQTPSS